MTGVILYILIFWEFLETINHLKKPYSRDSPKYTRSSLWFFALCFYPIKFCPKYNSVFILACSTSILEYFLVSFSSFLSFQTKSLRTFHSTSPLFLNLQFHFSPLIAPSIPLLPSYWTFNLPSLHISPLLQPYYLLSNSTLIFNSKFTFFPPLYSSLTFYSPSLRFSLLQPSFHLLSNSIHPFSASLLCSSLLVTLPSLLPSSPVCSLPFLHFFHFLRPSLHLFSPNHPLYNRSSFFSRRQSLHHLTPTLQRSSFSTTFSPSPHGILLLLGFHSWEQFRVFEKHKS